MESSLKFSVAHLLQNFPAMEARNSSASCSVYITRHHDQGTWDTMYSEVFLALHLGLQEDSLNWNRLTAASFQILDLLGSSHLIIVEAASLNKLTTMTLQIWMYHYLTTVQFVWARKLWMLVHKDIIFRHWNGNVINLCSSSLSL